MTVRPGTSEIWIGDVGWNTWEEINRIVRPERRRRRELRLALLRGPWPAAGLRGREPQHLREPLRDAGTRVTAAVLHVSATAAKVVPGETCANGSSSISGLAFYTAASLSGGLHGRAVLRRLLARLHLGDAEGGATACRTRRRRDVRRRARRIRWTSKIGPDGDLFYVDFDGGHDPSDPATPARNQSPTAVDPGRRRPSARRRSPVNFDAHAARAIRIGDTLTYAWDLDGDGAYDDSTSATPTFTYTSAGPVTVGLRVTDPGGLSGTTTVTVTATSGSGSLTYLSDLTPTTATNGYGPYEKGHQQRREPGR